MIFITQALKELGVDGFTLRGEPTNENEFKEYFSHIIGEDSNGHAIESNDCPVTWAQVVAKKEELEAKYNDNKYQRDRKAEYPSVIEQLDMLYHEGYDGWKAQIQAIKNKYLKG